MIPERKPIIPDILIVRWTIVFLVISLASGAFVGIASHSTLFQSIVGGLAMGAWGMLLLELQATGTN
jgi:hypothetical protein